MDGARYLEDRRLKIFRRNGTYYARLRLPPGQYVTRSLKTTVEETAVQLGRRLLFQMEYRAEQGLPPKSKLFSAVIDDYIRFRERDHAHGKTSAGMLRQIRRASKFLAGIRWAPRRRGHQSGAIYRFFPLGLDFSKNSAGSTSSASTRAAGSAWLSALGRPVQ
ncbi:MULTISPECIES: hypothetical protein [unclassified Bradyrhizobium]|uniref:hypothetical protein n=1 Tax=unclassified Bradyrhizobium TaxID=2631580 RepID=UPI0029168DCA|nr:MULTISPECIES: hypothetical protein [unclassified Bradyrhizobium]